MIFSTLWALGDGNRSDVSRRLFLLVCGYYVFAAYLTPSIGSIYPMSLPYFALVLPGWLYITYSWRMLLRPPSLLSKLWWLFVATSMCIGFLRGDLSLAYNGLYLGLLAIVVTNSGAYLRTKELNSLFLMAIFGSVVIYMMGLTEYGFLPGQAKIAVSCHSWSAFRVSLFRVPAESAAMALFVLIWNIFLPQRESRWGRWCFIFLALYFIVFSGVRSAAVALLLVSPLLIYRLLPSCRFPARALLSLMLPFAIVIISLYLMTRAPGGTLVGDFLAHYVLRHESCGALTVPSNDDHLSSSAITKGIDLVIQNREVSTEWVAKTFNRHCAARFQMNQFIEEPLLGSSRVRPVRGSENGVLGCDDESLSRYCISCVLSTYWLNKGGLAGVILIWIYLAQIFSVFRLRSLMGLTSLLLFGLFLQGWGTLFVPYHFTFYILLTLIPMLSSSTITRRNKIQNE